VVISAME